MSPLDREFDGLGKTPDFSPRAVELWRAPENGKAELGCFELFTPPTMYRDPTTNRFVLIQPTAKTKNPAVDNSFAAARQSCDQAQEPAFAPRIHLLGYVQRPIGDIVGVFQNMETSDVCVSAPGALPDGWSAAVENLQLDSPQLSTTDESATVVLSQARARIRDDVSGRSYTLWTDECSREPQAETAEIGTAQEIALSGSATPHFDH
jgi:hypothetical protein